MPCSIAAAACRVVTPSGSFTSRSAGDDGLLGVAAEAAGPGHAVARPRRRVTSAADGDDRARALLARA